MFVVLPAIGKGVVSMMMNFDTDLSTYQFVVSVFREKMEADTLLDTTGSTTSLLGIGAGDE